MFICNLWENKNTIRMANSCHKHSRLCCVKENPDEGSDAPPTLERSGSEQRVGAFNIPCPMRGKGLGESGGPSLKGKGGLVGFRKRSSLMLRKSWWVFESPFTINCEMMQSKSIISHHLAPFLMTCFIWHHCQIKSSYLCIVIQRE